MDTFLTAEEEEVLKIPGSFDIPSPRRSTGHVENRGRSDHGPVNEVEAEFASCFFLIVNQPLQFFVQTNAGCGFIPPIPIVSYLAGVYDV